MKYLAYEILDNCFCFCYLNFRYSDIFIIEKLNSCGGQIAGYKNTEKTILISNYNNSNLFMLLSLLIDRFTADRCVSRFSNICFRRASLPKNRNTQHISK